MSTQPSPNIDSTTQAIEEARSKAGFFRNLPIGAKLALGLGFLVILIFLVVAAGFLGTFQANQKIARTETVRVPAALTASRSQADLLRMQSDLRTYLAFGELRYREQYYRSAKNFEQDLVDLEAFKGEFGVHDTLRLQLMEEYYAEWSKLVDPLFALREDQLDREPAYRLLATEGIRHAGKVLIATNTLIETQADSPPSQESISLLEDMAKFQGTFSAMLSAMRGYTTTRNRIYKGEYEVNLAANDNAWERLQSQKDELSPSQQEALATIAENRQAFLQLPDKIFSTLESEEWRADLLLFQTAALPLADKMLSQLNELVLSQQGLLRIELAQGRAYLARTNQLSLYSGIFALAVALAMALLLRATIGGPIQRLTAVADKIRAGDLEAQATVESADETGVLAATFNSMTTKLRQVLAQVRKEKRRADDLLEVVIPIGVELSTERDFNMLLEKMLQEAKAFCKADAGTLYLSDANENNLKFVIVRNDSQKVALGGTTGKTPTMAPLPLFDASGAPNEQFVATRVANSGKPINLFWDDPSSTGQFKVMNALNPVVGQYDVRSMLAIPLKNTQGNVLGVLQLINPQDSDTGEISAFDPNLQEMMESFSSLAVAALEAYIREQSLRREINQLRIEIDEAKRTKAVDEIVTTDFFQHISTRAADLRQRRRSSKTGE